MADAEAYIREVRFLVQEELTQCYILVEARGDCPIGVQGWHHKTFPRSVSCTDIFNKIENGDDPLMWSLQSPTF